MNPNSANPIYELCRAALIQLRGLWRYRVHGLAFAWILCVGGWTTVYLLSDVYEARARVYVDTDSVLKPLLGGMAVPTDVIGQVRLMTEALLSGPQLEEAARKTGLHLRAQSPREFEALLNALRLKISIEGGRDNLYTISYVDSDRAFAQRLVQTLLDSFMEETLDENREDSTNAERFLNQQIASYAQRLNDAESQLAEFKKANVGLMPGNRGDYYTRLQNAMRDLEETRAAYRIARNRRDVLQQQLEGERPTWGIMQRGQASAAERQLQSQLESYQQQLDVLLLQYTEMHPDVMAIREVMADLENRLAEQRRNPTSAPQLQFDEGVVTLNSLDLNPVYQRTKIALKDTEVELVALQGKLAKDKADVDELQRMVNVIPEIEAQLAALNRDYDVNRSQHTALLKKLEILRLSQDMGESDNDKFRIIDPPNVPLKPVAPDRRLLLVTVLVAGLIGGFGLMFFLHQLNPIFSTRQQLWDVVGLPVLGAISLMRTATQQFTFRKQSTMFGAGVVMLLLFYGLALMFLETGVPWVQSALAAEPAL